MSSSRRSSVLFQGCALNAGEAGKETSLQTLRSYKSMTLPTFLSEEEEQLFHCANGTVTFAGKGPEVRPSDQIRQDTEKRNRKPQ